MDWNLIVYFLHYKGLGSKILTTSQEIAVRKLADGFGPGFAGEEVWDWSHVRDSSDAAVQAMAAEIRRQASADQLAIAEKLIALDAVTL